MFFELLLKRAKLKWMEMRKNSLQNRKVKSFFAWYKENT